MDNNSSNVDFNIDDLAGQYVNPFKKWFSSSDVVAAVKPPKMGLKVLLSLLITALVGAVVFYVKIPALNFKSMELYSFIILLTLVFTASFFLLTGAFKAVEKREYVKKYAKIPVGIIIALIVLIVVGFVAGSTLFRAKSYSQLMPVVTSDFKTDFEKIKYDEVPRLDESRAKTLADQQLGSLSEYKSQYVVSPDTTQINYNGVPTRVAYLQYADVFKWFNNTKNGLPAYMMIDLITQKVNVVNCVELFGEGIKYSPTELFNEKLIRHLRFQYPTAIFDTPNFEVMDDAHPYWITPVLDKTIGLFGGVDVKGVVITDALNGDSNYYSIDEVKNDESLSWIDVVYNERLLVQQYDFYGQFSNGFWNSIIFQNDVSVTSNGTGCIAMDDDVWVYTGVTSSEADASNFGFILANQRTKETRYYSNGGAMESSAMESAQDAVQNYGYYSCFPILLDIEGQPTYFMPLFGDSNTVKGYAFVNLADKTIVGTGLLDVAKSDAKALYSAVTNYVDALKDKNFIDNSVDTDSIIETPSNDNSQDTDTQLPTVDKNSITGKVENIKTSVNDGNTVYYLLIDGKYYYISVVDCMEVLLVETGDTVTVEFDKTDSNFVKAKTIKR